MASLSPSSLRKARSRGKSALTDTPYDQAPMSSSLGADGNPAPSSYSSIPDWVASSPSPDLTSAQTSPSFESIYEKYPQKLQHSSYFGPFLNFKNVDLEQNVWLGTILVISTTDTYVSEPEIVYRVDGESQNRQEVSCPKVKLDEMFGYNAWRFEVSVPILPNADQLVEYQLSFRFHPRDASKFNPPTSAYRKMEIRENAYGGDTIVHVSTHSFVVAGLNNPWRWMYFSCNGLDKTVAEIAKSAGEVGEVAVSPLWDDVVEDHFKGVEMMRTSRPPKTPSTTPGLPRGAPAASFKGYDIENEGGKIENKKVGAFHVMIGGGDQIYSDEVLFFVPGISKWMNLERHEDRETAPFTKETEVDTCRFFFDIYTIHFSQPAFGAAIGNIPSAFVIDDHDIIDGMGSYDTPLLSCPVIQGIKKVAFRFFLLFQQHTTFERARKDGLFGNSGYNWIKNFGPRISVLGLDNRGERTKRQIVKTETYDEIFQRLYGDQIPETCQHLIAIVAVPIVFPELKLLENFLNSMQKLAHRKMFRDAIAKSGLFKHIGLFFAGEVDLLDDVVDHWNGRDHKLERAMFLRSLQSFAEDRSIRVTFLSGDVHCCGVSLLQSTPDEYDFINPVNDQRLMYQITSSAITNLPPPRIVMWHFNRQGDFGMNKVHKMVRAHEKQKKKSGGITEGVRQTPTFESHVPSYREISRADSAIGPSGIQRIQEPATEEEIFAHEEREANKLLEKTVEKYLDLFRADAYGRFFHLRKFMRRRNWAVFEEIFYKKQDESGMPGIGEGGGGSSDIGTRHLLQSSATSPPPSSSQQRVMSELEVTLHVEAGKLEAITRRKKARESLYSVQIPALRM